ncbi:TetR/AcrR family transcriptional regulator [Baekduia soli]|uniref:TetR/AcrR family transcriptional regulator n=1 Tax=Baekduia soli TaxID=496014 RepID=UPI001651DEAC|nr:TetR/AcrR family transcriptional regulator [Baekduia soli]
MPAPPTRPALRERYERRRTEVVDAAAEVFARQGYHATSMQDLTDATGLAAGGLYHYIGSKAGLLVAICDELMVPLLAAARELRAQELAPEDELRGLVRMWVEHVGRHRAHMLVFQQERHVLEHEPQWRAVRASRKAFEDLLDDVLLRGERAGAFAFGDRRLALLALLGMVNHTPQWFRPRGRLTAEQVADGFVDLLLGVQGR